MGLSSADGMENKTKKKKKKQLITGKAEKNTSKQIS